MIEDVIVHACLSRDWNRIAIVKCAGIAPGIAPCFRLASQEFSGQPGSEMKMDDIQRNTVR